MTNELDYDEHLDRLGGELNRDAVLRDIYERDDVEIPWTSYVLAEPPEQSGELRGQVVLDTFEEYREDMTSEQVDELEQRLDDELTRRKGEVMLGAGLLASVGEAILEFFQPREDDGDGDDRDLLDDLESDPVEAVESGPVEDDLYGGKNGE